MSDPRSNVRVGSTEAMALLKQALARFDEEASAVVTGMDLEIRRAWHWLDKEMPVYWESRIKRLEFELSEARNALFRKRLQAQGNDRGAFATAEKEAVRRLERHLEEARAKLPIIRQWRAKFEHAIDEYNARVRGIRDETDGSIERHIDLLNRLGASIDAYSSTEMPKTNLKTTHADSETLESKDVQDNEQ